MRELRRVIVIIGVMLCLLFSVQVAAAHPLGNFTINHYSRLAFTDESVRVTYVLDFAEIPTFQQMKQLDTDGDGALSEREANAFLDAQLPGLIAGLHLTIGGKDVPLTTIARSATFVPGQGGLPTLRVEAQLRGDLPPGWQSAGAASYGDRNFQERLGWREIVVQGGSGVGIANASAPATDLSNELRDYPQDALSTPLAVSSATFTLTPSAASGDNVSARAANVRAPAASKSQATDQLAALITAEQLTPAVILVSIALALFWGAAHALSPGHGKAVVAAYLVGTRGTTKHAAFLGLTVTVTHTAGVFALGAVTLFLSRYLLPETLYPWLNVLSGLLVVAIALTLFYQRLRAIIRPTVSTDHTHDHSHNHDHDTDHSHEHDHAHGDAFVHTHDGHMHSHLPPGAAGERVTWRGLLTLGVSGGLIPCPSALVLLLSAIALRRLEFGLVLVVAFSAGLAVVLTVIGVLLVHARRLFERFSFEARVPRLLPVASALVMALAGLGIVLGALRQAGVI